MCGWNNFFLLKIKTLTTFLLSMKFIKHYNNCLHNANQLYLWNTSIINWSSNENFLENLKAKYDIKVPDQNVSNLGSNMHLNHLDVQSKYVFWGNTYYTMISAIWYFNLFNPRDLIRPWSDTCNWRYLCFGLKIRIISYSTWWVACFSVQKEEKKTSSSWFLIY